MPKIVDHDQKREEILLGCFSLFAERGFASVTMREIAQRLCVSTGTLYHYFSKKEALFEEMIASMSRKEIFEARAELQRSDDLQTRIDVLFRHANRNEEGFQKLLLMSLDYLRHSPTLAKKPLAQNVAMYRDVLASELGLEGTPLASLLFSFLVGMLIHRLLAPGSVDIPQHKDFLLTFATLLLEQKTPLETLPSKKERKKTLQKAKD